MPSDQRGRVCEVHSEYCPTGVCRWCGPEPVRAGAVGWCACRTHGRAYVEGCKSCDVARLPAALEPVRYGPDGQPYAWTAAERAAVAKARADGTLKAPAGFDIPPDAVLAGSPMGSRCIMPPEIAAHYKQASINFRTEAPGSLRAEISSTIEDVIVEMFAAECFRIYGCGLWPADRARLASVLRELTDDRTAKDCESTFSGLARFRGYPEKKS